MQNGHVRRIIGDRDFSFEYRTKPGKNDFTKKGLGKFLLCFGVTKFDILEIPGDREITVYLYGDYSEVEQKWIEKQINIGNKRIVFVVGGPYGFSKEVYEKSKFKISLSEMTFSHQMIRLIFVEQLYRAFTIIKGEPYHHV